MLTGRESLIRLIGKRRRIFLHRDRLLAAPVQDPSNILADNNGRVVSIGTAEKCRDEMSTLEAGISDESIIEEASSSGDVICPVCSNNVAGGDNMINMHLDACLSRKTKRKLTQSTLLQSKFWSRSKVQALPDESGDSETGVFSMRSNSFHELETTEENFDFGEVDEDDDNQCRQLHTESIKQGGVSERNDTVCCTVAPTQNNEVSEPRMDLTIEDIQGAALDTFIVGRKFSDVKVLDITANISLQRDPDNVKDRNAIKVVSVSSSFSKVLGYLPKELSEYLSPLIDNHGLKLEGSVKCIPNSSVEIVPIRLVHSENILEGQKEHKDITEFKYLWKKAFQVAEHRKECPRDATKYQHNFNILIHEVLERNSHLFNPDEQALLESFPSLSEDSQRLFVRLYMRKGPWFRQSTISYPEVSNSLQSIQELIVRDFFTSFEDINEPCEHDVKEVLDLLTVSELRDMLCTLKKNSSRGLRKKDLISCLYSVFKDGSCPSSARIILGCLGLCIRISTLAESLLWRAERLFFLNGDQDLSSFVLQDLGIVKYPSYKCIVSEQIFSSRMELLAYEEAIETAQIMDESLDKDDFGMVLRCIMIADSQISNSSAQTVQSPESLAFTSCFTASWVYSKMVLLGVSFLEHQKRYNQAVYLLKRLLDCFNCDGRRGYWTIRLSTDLEHMGCPNESLSVAELGLQDQWVRAGSRMALQRRILRLAKPPRRWKTPSFSETIKRKIPEVHVQGRPLNCEIGMKNRFYGEDGEQCGVEQLALQFYAGEGGGWQGVHSESGIWLTIFGLLMWDILFTDVPHVFQTKFQTAPLDLGTDSFYQTRKNLIESHLQNIAEGMGEEIVIVSWETYYGTACRGVSWDRYTLDQLRAAVTCTGGPCLASLCRHLAQDYRSWSSGMPDLLLWRFFDEKGYGRGQAKLVEVKSPRDRLSEQQRAWLLLLMDCGFDVEVCRVGPGVTGKSSR